MTARIKVTAVQITSGTDVAANITRAKGLVLRAVDAGAEFIALPEDFGFLGSDAEKLGHAQSIEDGPFLLPFREIAAAHHVAILAGSIPERSPCPNHIFNTSVLIGPAGETLAAYRKIHLFDVELSQGQRFHESDSVIAGATLVVAPVKEWSAGLSLCYDLRFPELYRELSAQGARILCIPSAFILHTGQHHWETLVRARAIENLCYVVAPNQFGQHSQKRKSCGKSMLVDPWGTILSVAPEQECFIAADFDADAQDAIRRQIPALTHRRL